MMSFYVAIEQYIPQFMNDVLITFSFTQLWHGVLETTKLNLPYYMGDHLKDSRFFTKPPNHIDLNNDLLILIEYDFNLFLYHGVERIVSIDYCTADYRPTIGECVRLYKVSDIFRLAIAGHNTP